MCSTVNSEEKAKVEVLDEPKKEIAENNETDGTFTGNDYMNNDDPDYYEDKEKPCCAGCEGCCDPMDDDDF